MHDGVDHVRPLAVARPWDWLRVFGPGAIIASLTIGTGELVFSSRGGAIFGYPVLLLFVAICGLKWCLVYSTARHMVLSGGHPLERWMELPWGPRGWLPVVLFFFAAVCIPVWLSFHATVLGNLMSRLIDGGRAGGSDAGWGLLILTATVLLSLRGGYAALERVQLVIVGGLLAAVTVALCLFQPDWLSMAKGLLLPQPLRFPSWLLDDPRPSCQAIAARSVWEEATLYVGVIGGASYDYLAYTSFLRDKKWGLAAHPAPAEVLRDMPAERSAALRSWVRAPLVDCTLSFLVVIAFSAVFVASGAVVLGPERQIPSDDNFLEHQAQFVTRIHPWLYPLYVAGALLAMLGTLYGTLEVAPTVLRETLRSIGRGSSVRAERWARRMAVLWSAGLAAALLLWSLSCRWRGIEPPAATDLLKPANLFTGVLSCGLICLLNPWVDARFLPKPLRMPAGLAIMNGLAGCILVMLGLKGYWEFGAALGLAVLAATVAGGWLVAWWAGRWLGFGRRGE